MTSPAWIVVETLSKNGPHSVVVDGHRPKSWASLGRARSRLGADVAHSLSVIVDKCISSGEEREVDVVRRQGGDPIRVIGVPILGAFGRVHGVHVWAGGPTETPPPRRGVYAWDWDSERELAYQGPGLEAAIHGLSPEQCKVERTASESFRSIVRFDDRLGYLDLCGNVHGGGSWQGEITFLGEGNGLHQLQMIAKASMPGERKIIHGLHHDITDIRPPEPMVEMSALRAVAAASGGGVVFIALEPALLYDWLAPPPPPLDRWVSEHPEIPDEDRRTLTDACRAILADGETREFEMQVRFSGSGWLTIDAVLTRVSDSLAPHGILTVRERGSE